MNAQARQWLKEVAKVRKHRETLQRPDERFQPESLKPLPAMAPDYRDAAEALVHKDIRIPFDGNRYCVPPRCVGHKLTIKADASSVTFYHQHQELAYKAEPELDRLSNVLRTFNDSFATLFTDADRVSKRIRDDIAPKVAGDATYQNANENTPHTARMARDQALGKVMQVLLKDDTQSTNSSSRTIHSGASSPTWCVRSGANDESANRFGRANRLFSSAGFLALLVR